MRNELRIVALLMLMVLPIGAMGQIFNPEGLNMPGQWNGFANLPTNLALASATQVTNGRVAVITTGVRRYQTTFSVAASGADLVGGTYNWLFTSGPSGNPYNNKWAGVNVVLNTKQTYSFNTGADNSITITNGRHYVMNWRDNGYASTQAVFLELSEAPTSFESISDVETVSEEESYTVALTVSDALATEERVYVRYTTNNYATSSVVLATFDGTSGSAVIPAQTAGTTVKYYAFTTVGTAVESDLPNSDLYSMKISSGGEYTSVAPIDPPSAIALTAPADAATSVALRPIFTWEENEDATTYQFQVSTDSEFGSTFINQSGLTDETFTPSSNLRMNTTFHWRVRGVNGGGNGDWSTVRSFTTVPATVTLRGNGGGGFGEIVGGSTMAITHDDTHLYFEFTKGAGAWSDILVLYFDTKSGGVTSTTTLTDVADNHRRAISGNLSDLDFPTGFSSDYALAMNSVYGGVWATNGAGTLGEPVSSPSFPSGSGVATHSFRISKSEWTFDTENTFSVIGTYLNGSNGFRSNESFGIGFIDSNPGDADITLRSFHNYPSGDFTADVKFFGNQGWRFLANPFTGLTLNDYLAPLWTQGFPGSDAPGAGVSNVLTFNGSTFVSAGNQSDAMPRGKGFVVGVFEDDSHGVEGSFPKTVTVTGTPSYESVTPALNATNEFVLVGNPFPFAIDFDNITRSGMSDIAYVYDYVDVEPSSPDAEPGTAGIYRAWNGSAGSLTAGRIASFQSFLVHAASEGASLTMDAEDRTSPTLYFGKEVAPRSFELVLSGDGLYSNAWIDISDEAKSGFDSKDAIKLQTFERDRAVLYTTGDGLAFDINHLPVSEVIEIPLGIESTKSGRMTLNRGEWSLPLDWSVYVRDTQTGVVRELKEGIGMDVEPTRIARKAAPSTQIERVAAVAPRYTLIIDPLSTTDIVICEPMMDFALEQNYPNPFNPTTTIGFRLAVGGKATVTVHDILGREVAVLVNGTMSAGYHSVTFNAEGLSSGVYLLRLQAGGQTQIRQMTLLK